jgi:hypothetical protein
MPSMIHQQTVDQLGGQTMLKLMLEVNRIDCFHENEKNCGYLVFKFKGSTKYNLCQIELDYSDTYTVRFGKAKRDTELNNLDQPHLLPKDGEWLSSTSLVYADQLQGHFELTTNLLTSMGTVQASYGQ